MDFKMIKNGNYHHTIYRDATSQKVVFFASIILTFDILGSSSSKLGRMMLSWRISNS